jgi:O-antigen ligase
LLWGWDAFLHHPFFGIGFGADSTYTATVQPPEIVDPYERSYLQTPGTPFVNPFIEAGATMGFFGLASLIMIVIVFVARFIGIKKKHCQEALFVRSIFVGFFVMFLTLQAEATFLRFYVWSTFGLACGAALRWRTLNVRKSIFDQQEVHLE